MEEITISKSKKASIALSTIAVVVLIFIFSTLQVYATSTTANGTITTDKTSITCGLSETCHFVVNINSDVYTWKDMNITSTSSAVDIIQDENVVNLIPKTMDGFTISVSLPNGAKANVGIRIKSEPTSISFTKEVAEVGLGESIYLSPYLSPSDSASNYLPYCSSNSSVATVDWRGCVKTTGTGKTTIVCKTYNDLCAKCRVTVKPMAKSVSISESDVTLGIGESITLSSSVPNGYGAYSRHFYSEDSTVATIGKTTGKLTAKKAGTTRVYVTLSNGVKSYCTVKVVNAPTSVSLNESELTLGIGEYYELDSDVPNVPSNTYASEVKYSSSNTSVAVVDEYGYVDAKSVGTATIKATLYNGVKDTCKVTVKEMPTSVSLNKTSLTLGISETYTLKASIPTGTYAHEFEYFSYNSNIASINSNGVVTAKASGTTTVGVRLLNGATATCSISVKPLATSVGLNITNVTLGVGESCDLNSTIPSGTAAYYRYFYSNNSSVASITKSGGIVTAKNIGTTTVYVQLVNGKRCNCTVTVKALPKTTSEYKLNYTDVTLITDSTIQLKAVMPSTCAVYDNNFTSANTAVATVTKDGTIKAKSKGTTTITATTINGLTRSCTVRVLGTKQEIANEVLNKTNAQRRANGLQPLTLDTSLQTLANTRAEEISRTNCFSHIRPDGSKITDLYPYKWSGENIACYQTSAEEVTTAWYNSDNHRKNILNSHYTKLGVGIYIKDGLTYWIQDFTS